MQWNYFINIGGAEKSIFRIGASTIEQQAVNVHRTLLVSTTTTATVKRKIEIMNKLLWINTLPNTLRTSERASEKANSKLLMLIIWFWLCLPTFAKWAIECEASDSIDFRSRDEMHASSIQFMLSRISLPSFILPKLILQTCSSQRVLHHPPTAPMATQSQFFILFNFSLGNFRRDFCCCAFLFHLCNFLQPPHAT